MKALETYTQTATDIANAANGVWEMFADMDGDKVPANPLDAMQVQLVRWQRANFGDVSPVDKVDVHMGLGVIEEFGETIGADEIDGSKGKLDGLGDICVYAGQLLNANRMAIRPVMDLADLIAADLDGNPDRQELMDPTALQGSFAHILLKHEQKIRGYDKREVWLPQLALHIAAFMAYAKMDILWTSYENLEARIIPEDNLIQRTYIEVGGGVVLKRNWQADRIAGQTPA